MLVLTHAFVSGAVGERLGSPIFAFFAGILAHFIVDKVPHFWPKSEKSQSIVKILDGVFAAATVLVFYQAHLVNSWSLLAGALGGILVDAVLVLTPLETKSKIGLWHTNRQIHKTKLIYYFADFVLITLSVIAIWKFQ